MPADLLAKLKKNASARERLLAERDELIVQARSAGMPVTRIAEAVGLSAMHVHRIINAARLRH